MRPGYSRGERAWVLYDVANSAYSLAVTSAIFPLFFKNVIAAGVPGATSTAWLAFANSLFTLVVAVLATLLGPMADYEGRKKRFFASFFLIGVAGTAALAFAAEGRVFAALAIYVVSGIGFASANVFYDAFLTDVTTPERMDRVSAAGYAWGYIGSTLPFVMAMAVVLGAPRLGLLTDVTGVRIAFVITAAWWLAFTAPLLRRVRQVHFLLRAGPSVGDTVRDALRRLTTVVREVRRYRTVVLFLVAYFFYIDGVGTVIKLATAYGTDIGLSSETLLVVLLAVQVVAFPCALLYGRLAMRTSPRTMLLAGIAVYTVVTALAFAIPRLPEAAQVPMFDDLQVDRFVQEQQVEQVELEDRHAVLDAAAALGDQLAVDGQPDGDHRLGDGVRTARTQDEAHHRQVVLGGDLGVFLRPHGTDHRIVEHGEDLLELLVVVQVQVEAHAGALLHLLEGDDAGLPEQAGAGEHGRRILEAEREIEEILFGRLDPGHRDSRQGGQGVAERLQVDHPLVRQARCPRARPSPARGRRSRGPGRWRWRFRPSGRRER